MHKFVAEPSATSNNEHREISLVMQYLLLQIKVRNTVTIHRQHSCQPSRNVRDTPGFLTVVPDDEKYSFCPENFTNLDFGVTTLPSIVSTKHLGVLELRRAALGNVLNAKLRSLGTYGAENCC